MSVADKCKTEASLRDSKNKKFKPAKVERAARGEVDAGGTPEETADLTNAGAGVD